MDRTVEQLVEFYTKNIAENNKNKAINLVGNIGGSVFLRNLDRRALNLGIVTVHNDDVDRFRTVIDIETCSNEWVDSHEVNEANDLDNIYNHGTSSVAQGIYEILKNKTDLTGKVVLIIGRGHSVKGLENALVRSNATVIIAHSKTANIERMCNLADYIVTSTNNVDLSNFKDKVVANTQSNYPSGLGKLTTSILLYRAVC